MFAWEGYRHGCLKTHEFSSPRGVFAAIAANISELFRPLEKPPLPALPFFVGC